MKHAELQDLKTKDISIESLRLEKTAKITTSNHQPTMPTHLVPQCCISTALEDLQGW